MKGKYLIVLLIAISIVGRAIYNTLYFVYSPDINIISLILSFALLFLGIYYLYMDSKKKFSAKMLIPFFIVEILVFLINLAIYRIEGKTAFTTLELGIIGSGIDVIINTMLIIYILIANRGYEKYGRSQTK
ncbi:MAG: hypothetical protein ACTHVE_07770 [Senegalia sp. (in: firmicutes)]|uniref:hypothetical protein n=1 Tax=Senegalia sp. (in: firmicutes) TaxID=1924098 RepID=UPI003F9E9F1F